MPARSSEAFTLRTYPFGEADLVVSFFTKDEGKLRGVAKRARKPKSPFGSGLERLSLVRMDYFQRENSELARLDGCEVISSPFGLAGDYAMSVALDYLTEVSEHLLPPHEPNEKFFRLLNAVVTQMRLAPSKGPWAAVNYFSFWAVKLSGFLPELKVSEDSLRLAQEMARMPVAEMGEQTRASAADLRRQMIRAIESQIERRLITVPVLESL